jgi:hypothetical protein
MTPDEAGVLVDALGDAFGSGDVEAVVSLFAGDGDVMYAGSEAGEVAVGVPALRLLLAGLFARDERYSWRTDRVQVGECAAGCVVLADATLVVVPWPPSDGGAEPESLPCRVSGLLEGRDGAWRWRFCHTSEPAPAVG